MENLTFVNKINEYALHYFFSDTPSIAFRSHNLTDTNLHSFSILVFGNTSLNLGNGYDNQTGVFTAPTAGLYFFSVQFCISSSGNDFIHFGIVQNSEYIKRSFIQGNNYSYECYDFNVVSMLRQNDRVYVESTSGSGQLYQTPERWNEFSGFLVHE